MNITYVTHYDELYKAQAYTMLNSLYWRINAPDKCKFYEVLLDGDLEDERHIHLRTIEHWAQQNNINLADAKTSRSWKEYCWILEPTLITYMLMERIKEDDILVYVDSDLFFFGNPEQDIRHAMQEGEVALTPHRFPPGLEYREDSVGKFNFGFGIFKNTNDVQDAVFDWTNHSIAGDVYGVGGQKFLDTWPWEFGTDFIELGAGHNIGPWQLIEAEGIRGIYDSVYDTEVLVWSSKKESINRTNLMSYHFHEFRRGTGKNPIHLKHKTLQMDEWNRTNYKLTPSAIRHIYLPYEEALQKHL